MESLFIKKVPLYFETEESQLVLGDSFKILTKMEESQKYYLNQVLNKNCFVKRKLNIYIWFLLRWNERRSITLF